MASRLFRCSIALVLVGTGCANPPVRSKRLEILAASSLRDVFGALALDFERRRPGVELALSFAGSQSLRAQIELGATADIFASADWRHVRDLASRGIVSESRVFARNTLVIAVPASNPAGLRSFEDLPGAARIIAGAPEAPIGAYFGEMLARSERVHGPRFAARVRQQIRSREPNARQILAKLLLGEADAAVVYRSDAWPVRDRLTIIDVPPSLSPVAEYPAAVLRAADSPELAREWIDALLGDTGQGMLRDGGFQVLGPP